MKLIRAVVENYKSFSTSISLDFAPDFNVVVGKNNAGKTALLEALSLRFQQEPHRSLITAKERTDAMVQSSLVDLLVGTSGLELTTILSSLRDIKIPFTDGGGHTNEDEAKRLVKVLFEAVRIRFPMRMSGGGEAMPGAIQEPYTGTPVPNGLGALFSSTKPGETKVYRNNNAANDGLRIERILASAMHSSVYSFRAERLNVGISRFGPAVELEPNAQNLPEVLHNLQTRNSYRYELYIEFVRRVFPSIEWIAAQPRGDQQVEIVVWEHERKTEREDLAVPLLRSGTGIGQVLAMLYVVVTADRDRILVIDEPNSFLHPGAIRALFEIFQEHPRHQYIVSTHVPQTIASVGIAARVHLLRKNADRATTVVSFDARETAALSDVLSDVGARLSDVFAADRILWVEGTTEELCFKVIAQRLMPDACQGVAILGVLHTADFDRRNLSWALEIYRRLSSAGSLMPPAIGFIFDRETRTEQEINDVVRESKGAVSFLSARMYENYLLVPEAIAWLLGTFGIEETAESIEADLRCRKATAGYFPRGEMGKESEINGARVLHDIVSERTNGTHAYSKTRDGLALSRWILDHQPALLTPVSDLIGRSLLRDGTP
jgi:predicted ATPase